MKPKSIFAKLQAEENTGFLFWQITNLWQKRSVKTFWSDVRSILAFGILVRGNLPKGDSNVSCRTRKNKRNDDLRSFKSKSFLRDNPIPKIPERTVCFSHQKKKNWWKRRRQTFPFHSQRTKKTSEALFWI